MWFLCVIIIFYLVHSLLGVHEVGTVVVALVTVSVKCNGPGCSGGVHVIMTSPLDVDGGKGI